MLCASVLLCPLAAAITVHTWIDSDGVRHFADAPPAGDQPATVIELADMPVAAADDDYYSIVNQWKRLRAERESAAVLSLERERIEAAAPTPPAADYAEPPRRLAIYPGAYGYGYPLAYVPPRPAPFMEMPSAITPRRNANVNTPVPLWPRQR